jgi:anti-sigma factor ChrR (cupin superfamily)
MDAVTPKTKNDTKTKSKADPRSHHVRPANMEWQKTRFPGCEIKTLLFDPENGVITALTRFAPGAELPDHEHVMVEQTFVIEGRLIDREGPDGGLEIGPGEFVWRDPGSRHSAYAPDGGIMLSMFQIPNKFYERDGRVTDPNGQDWETAWAKIFKG